MPDRKGGPGASPLSEEEFVIRFRDRIRFALEDIRDNLVDLVRSTESGGRPPKRPNSQREK